MEGVHRLNATLVLVVALVSGAAAATTQQVALAPAIASMDGAGGGRITLQGRISRVPDNLKRQWIIDHLPLKVQPPPDRSDPHFRRMVGQFFSDSEGLERVRLRLGGRELELPRGDDGGVFSLEVPLRADELARLQAGGSLAVQTIATAKTPASVQAPVVWLGDEGLTVITDVDDTIKVTEVGHPPARDRNTFVRPFVAVPGMPDLYRHWSERLDSRLHFHVVSAGPWQMLAPLQAFAAEAGFPPFTWQMRSMKITNAESLAEIWDRKQGLRRAEQHKVDRIAEFLRAFPRRRVILVGDSGERDPEAYARVAQRFAAQVAWILIRDVTGDPQLRQRGDPALYDPPGLRDKLKVFTDPRALKDLPLPAR